MRTAIFRLPHLLAALAVLLLPSIAGAHPGHGSATGFACGFEHPFHGLDHVLAMVAVGLWAAQLGGRALWAIPLTFISVMAAAGAAGLSGTTIPFVEPGIAASVLVLGLLIAFAVRLSLPASALIVGLFAVFHGYAHGAEMKDAASVAGYCGGFVLSTVLLHAAGISFGIAVQRCSDSILRASGTAVALAGVMLALA